MAIRVRLLYPDREWTDAGAYYDSESLIQDLGLSILFQVASRNQEPKEGSVQHADEADRHLGETLKKVMTVPLRTKEEIYYRQEILRDCMENPEFMESLYGISRDMTFRWEALGKRQLDKPGSRDKSANLLSRIEILHLFVNTLARIRDLCRRYDAGQAFDGAAAEGKAGEPGREISEEDCRAAEGKAGEPGREVSEEGRRAAEGKAGEPGREISEEGRRAAEGKAGEPAKTAGQLRSPGLRTFCRGVEEAFGEEQEERIRGILSDILFYCDGQEEYSLSGSGSKKESVPRMVFGCGVEEGMKFGGLCLEEVSTAAGKLKSPAKKCQ